MTERLEATCRTFETLERQLADPSVAADPDQLLKLARERSRLEPLVIDYRQLQELEEQHLQAQQLLRDNRGDSDLEALAQEELQSLEQQQTELQQRLRIALLPHDPRDERSVMLEIRAGAGGDAAEATRSQPDSWQTSQAASQLAKNTGNQH